MALSDLLQNPNQPPPVLPPDLMSGLGGNQPPQLPQMGLRDIVTSPRQQTEQNIQAQIAKFNTPASPKGFWQNLAHITAQNPFSMAYRNTMEKNRESELTGLENQDIAQQTAGSENELRGAQGDYYRAHAQEVGLSPLTPEEATAYGNPALAGVAMNAAQREALARQAGINTTKTTTNAATNQTKLTAANLEAMNKIQPHITVEVGGEPHVMERDPATHAYSIDRGVAPPNYASMLPEVLGTKTTELLGPDNVMHRYQYDPATRTYSDDIGAAPTGTAQHQIFQGAAIEQLGPQVINDINASRDILGNMDSYYKQWLSGTPVSDPRAAQLMTELMSFAAMQPALHGFRSTNALEAFEKMIGGLSKNPDATIATINGIMKTPEAFTNLARPAAGKGPAAPPPPKAGDVVDGYRFKGGSPSDQKNWEQVKK